MRLKNKTVFWGIMLFVLLNILCFWKPDAVMAAEFWISGIDLYGDPKNILAESDFSLDCPREISVTYKDMEDEDIGILEDNTDILVRDYIEHGMGEGITVSELPRT